VVAVRKKAALTAIKNTLLGGSVSQRLKNITSQRLVIAEAISKN
jgi:hypothetical protein